MPGRGGINARRRTGARRESGRSVSEEITVLVNTLRELAAIRSTAEDAAGRILESAEGLLAFADKEEAKKAEEAILSIVTACGFHDLVGQRVTKITETLDRVIATRMKRVERRRRVLEAAPRRRKPKLSLDGAGLLNTGLDQARIDALLGDTKLTS